MYPHFEPTYSQTSPPPASFAKKALIFAAVAFGAVFMAAILAAVAIPTFLTVKEAASGNAWFNGGVPGWPRVDSTGLNFSGGPLSKLGRSRDELQRAGPLRGGVRVSRQLPAGETAKQYFPTWLSSWSRMVIKPT